MWGTRGPNQNSYYNWDFGKFRLPTLLKSGFLVTRSVLLFLLIPVLILLLRLLQFELVTVDCTLTGTSNSTSYTPCNSISTTCTTSSCTLVKLSMCDNLPQLQESKICSVLFAWVSYSYSSSASKLNKLKCYQLRIGLQWLLHVMLLWSV